MIVAFDVDTGIDATPTGPDFSFGFSLMDAVMDALPENPTQAQIDDKLTQWVLGDLRKPKTMKTIRAKFISHWPLIAPLAIREPDLFDSILNEMAELASFKS